jgi:hypothetical protein
MCVEEEEEAEEDNIPGSRKSQKHKLKVLKSSAFFFEIFISQNSTKI